VYGLQRLRHRPHEGIKAGFSRIQKRPLGLNVTRAGVLTIAGRDGAEAFALLQLHCLNFNPDRLLEFRTKMTNLSSKL
jgi:hypothetical protein